jgi:hypothetical protein
LPGFIGNLKGLRVNPLANWARWIGNPDRHSCTEPITTAFSEDVGHILAELPIGAEPRPQYRFYM